MGEWRKSRAISVFHSKKVRKTNWNSPPPPNRKKEKTSATGEGRGGSAEQQRGGEKRGVFTKGRSHLTLALALVFIWCRQGVVQHRVRRRLPAAFLGNMCARTHVVLTPFVPPLRVSGLSTYCPCRAPPPPPPPPTSRRRAPRGRVCRRRRP